jgi:tetratricopeptide (TPR) repeat protein
VNPANFKVAYAYAAIPSRVFLENKKWKEAASLQTYPANFSWVKFPWQEAVIHFTRLLGAVNLGNISESQAELIKLNQLHDTLEKQKDFYKSRQVEIQIKTSNAWIQFKSGKKDSALNLMQLAADIEDSTEKQAVTPGAVLPARELLADMLLQMQQYKNALHAYEEVLSKCPNRFNSLYGAGLAAEKSGNMQKALLYYNQLLTITGPVNSDRIELSTIRSFLAKH